MIDTMRLKSPDWARENVTFPLPIGAYVKRIFRFYTDIGLRMTWHFGRESPRPLCEGVNELGWLVTIPRPFGGGGKCIGLGGHFPLAPCGRGSSRA